MKYLSTFLEKLILQKRGCCPAKGMTASFFSTKYDADRHRVNEPTISTSVVQRLSLSKHRNFFSNLEKHPFAFVVIVEASKGPFRGRTAT